MSLLSLSAWMNVLLLYLVFHWGMLSGVLMWESMSSSSYVSAFIECMNECFVIVYCLSLRYAKWCSDVGIYELIMSLLSLSAWMNVLLLYLVFHWGMLSGVLMWESMGSSLYISAFIECKNECFVIVSCLSLRYAKWCSDVGVYGLIIVCPYFHWEHRQ